ncbi:hypothetical protein [Pontibacter arcticus]|uniref:Uncharacterized protein n=1 Tax=Pontibacter arcticus TaxID=2080288 RepID=A0A364RJY2_9BACT|nr:hypothetical protein [Pontibacter arcticus]RAU84546.1 hypothetical protein DP923_05065 [Pontibacter arcticus]
MKFYRNLVVLTIVCAGVILLLLEFTGSLLINEYIWHMLGFFVFVTAFTYYICSLGYKHDKENYQVYHFSSMGFRMVLCIGVVFAYAYFKGENKLQFVFNFFVLYFLYTGFEIYSLLANLRPHLKEQN